MKRKTQDTAAMQAEPVELSRELERRRELAAARQADELARERAEAGHDRARADVAQETRLAELARAEREAEAGANAELAAVYRSFRSSGERIRIKSQMARSGEARALKLEWLRSRNHKILVPILIGFGLWSTTGVQAGAARLMDVTRHDPVWWALWGLEALLIGAVAWIIVSRATLAASGGKIAEGAEKIAIGCLTTSIFLNLIAAIPADPSQAGFAVIGSMFTHAIGPVMAAVTAHLIGLIDASIAEADPWHETKGSGASKTTVAVPRLADMDLRSPVLGAVSEAVPAPSRNALAAGPENAGSEVPVTVWPVPREDRLMLPIVARPGAVQALAEDAGKATEKPARTTADRPRRAGAGTYRRPNKGVPVPPSARPPATSQNDEELAEELVSLIDQGRVSEDAPYREVKTALGIGYERAKRIRALYEERARELEDAIVRDLPEPAQQRPGLAMVAGGEQR